MNHKKTLKTLHVIFKAIPANTYTTKYGTFGLKKCPYGWIESLMGKLGMNGPLAFNLRIVDRKYISKLKLTPVPGAKYINMNRPLQDIAEGKFIEYQQKTIKGRTLAAIKDTLTKFF